MPTPIPALPARERDFGTTEAEQKPLSAKIKNQEFRTVAGTALFEGLGGAEIRRECLQRVDTVEKVRKKINGERLVHVIAT